ncbi:MAG TPA: hypothetical protein VFJ65_12820 [Solirubrobacterales bacterium]|nr:hypothetical protein [Solirubrobacterales bacterium]
MPAIEGSERDNTQDWIVPRGTVPLVSDLEARIDEALVIARASEEGVREVGEMALDAARQARRAAEAAEKSAAVAVAARMEPATEQKEEEKASRVEHKLSPVEEPSPPPQPRFEARFRTFTERADRVSARLRRLGASHPSGPSVGAARRRGAG